MLTRSGCHIGFEKRKAYTTVGCPNSVFCINPVRLSSQPCLPICSGSELHLQVQEQSNHWFVMPCGEVGNAFSILSNQSLSVVVVSLGLGRPNVTLQVSALNKQLYCY